METNVTMDADFTEEEVKSALNEKEQQAEEQLKDEAKTRETLNKAEKLLDKLKRIPVIGDIVDDIAASIELIKDFIDGTYRRVPVRVIVSALAAILYVISPIDLIPDFIPIIGWLDDATVFALVLSYGLGAELNAYRRWKRSQEDEPVYNKIWPESDEEEDHIESEPESSDTSNSVQNDHPSDDVNSEDAKKAFDNFKNVIGGMKQAADELVDAVNDVQTYGLPNRSPDDIIREVLEDELSGLEANGGDEARIKELRGILGFD